jgi:phage terminase large subunit GpA-like protein
LAFRRTTTFRRSKKLLISSPTLKGASRIHDEFLLGTQEEWLVPCPHCHQYQLLKWGAPETKYGMKWDDRRSDPYYLCEHCACVIEERWKPWMNARGRWVAKNPSAGPRVRSFFKNALTAALASWRKIRDEWLAVQHKPLELQTFINTVLCELYDPEGANRLDPDTLYGRLETYPAEVPSGVAVLVRVTDVQDDRLETTVWGFGANEEMWLIDFDLIPGNPSLTEGIASPWAAHDSILGKSYTHEFGSKLIPEVTFIDSGGHATKEVYTYTRTRQHRGVYAIKGHNIESAPLLSKPTRNNSQRALLYMIGVSTAKESIQRRLARIKRPAEWTAGQPVPGYIHLPAAQWMDRSRVEQLANEVRVPEIVDGYVKHVWKKKGPNELFDMAGYALAALQRFGPAFIQQLGAMADKLRTTAQTTPPPPEAPQGLQVPREVMKQQRGGWVGGWRGR